MGPTAARFGAGTSSREMNSSIAAAAITKLAMANIHGRTRCRGCDLLGSEAGAIPTVFGVRLPSTGAMKRYPRRASVSMKMGVSADSPSASRNLLMAAFRL